MNTTTATYSISVTTDEGIATFYKTMPTKPTTSKGIKSQNTKLSKWVENYPNFIEYEILPAWGHLKCPCSISTDSFFLSSDATFFQTSFHGC